MQGPDGSMTRAVAHYRLDRVGAVAEFPQHLARMSPDLGCCRGLALLHARDEERAVDRLDDARAGIIHLDQCLRSAHLGILHDLVELGYWRPFDVVTFENRAPLREITRFELRLQDCIQRRRVAIAIGVAPEQLARAEFGLTEGFAQARKFVVRIDQNEQKYLA